MGLEISAARIPGWIASTGILIGGIHLFFVSDSTALAQNLAFRGIRGVYIYFYFGY